MLYIYLDYELHIQEEIWESGESKVKIFTKKFSLLKYIVHNLPVQYFETPMAWEWQDINCADAASVCFWPSDNFESLEPLWKLHFNKVLRVGRIKKDCFVKLESVLMHKKTETETLSSTHNKIHPDSIFMSYIYHTGPALPDPIDIQLTVLMLPFFPL